MWPRLGAKEFRERKGVKNRRALRRLVDDRPPGLLGYRDGEAVAWVAVAPRTELVRIERTRGLARIDDAPVWSIPCLFVGRAARGQGVTTAMIEAAVAFARGRGARMVEAYPLDGEARRAPGSAWWGFAPAFARAGFVEAARGTAGQQFMRRET
jgi:GNAT superfamily N-acetyltransferase